MDGLVAYPARFFWISSGAGLMHADWSEGEPTVHSADESTTSIICPSVSCLPMSIDTHASCQSIIGAFGIGDAGNYPLDVLADLTQFLLDYNLTI